ncbi:MAG: family type secretion target [Schumannella sp.]|nr:family type secretion target [Schumannella sp.]
MTRYQVDSDAVAAVTGNVRASMGRIQGEVSGLLGQLVGLQSSWTGQASAGFQGVVTDWRATQQRVEESLAAIGAALEQAARGYADIEQANAQLFRR